MARPVLQYVRYPIVHQPVCDRQSREMRPIKPAYPRVLGAKPQIAGPVLQYGSYIVFR
jgi:hypothetical protein